MKKYWTKRHPERSEGSPATGWRSLATLGVTLCLASNAHAIDLLDVYQDALANDTQFKAAYSTYLSTAEALPQAISSLLPQITILGQGARNKENAVAGIFSIDTTFYSNQFQLLASQTIFNFQAWKTVSKATAAVKSAQATFNNAAEDLMLRITNAYLDVLLSQDTLNFSEAKKRANKRQYDQANERFKVGLDAITSVYEAKAAYNQSVAEVIASKNNQINKNENLRRLTNHIYEYLAPLRNGKIPLIKPEPNNIDEWVNTGLRQNYNLLAAKYALEAARENIKAQTAGNWPTLSLQGNASTTNNNVDVTSSVFIPDQLNMAAVALNMNFPIVQGGLVLSKTRQAKYDFQTSSEQLESTYRDVVVNSRISFNTIIDSISKVEADRQTVISRVNQVNSTEAQFEAGTRTMVDVTNAQERLFEAQEEQAADQYNLIRAMLRLKYLAGTLNVNDLSEINAWLATTRINQFAHKRP
ncbi:MAG: TolC family outer membrane protein [Gammaproteobacteria bacterium]|nr:TolC family outer membrane protein [Gammaproteobacteria bacterium]